MLKHRALAYAPRDAFPDVLAGVYTPEEMGMRNVTGQRDRLRPRAWKNAKP
jgi:hypothetical protein